MTETSVDALIVRESSRSGFTAVAVIEDVTDRLVTGEGDGDTVRLGAVAAEGVDGRAALAVTVPAEPVNGLPGWFVLRVGASGSEPVDVDAVEVTGTGLDTAVTFAVGPGGSLDGRWAYSLHPKVRTVTLYDEIMEETATTDVLHLADLSELVVEPQPAEPSQDRLRFVIPSWAVARSAALGVCEETFWRLAETAGDDSVWPQAVIDGESLDQVATGIEADRSTSSTINVTVETPSGETVRGDRLQPMVRYPITVVAADGGVVPAVMGCSVS